MSELCEQTAVLYLGRIAESGPTGELLQAPAHPYTEALRSAVPEIDWTARRTRVVLPGEPPDAASPPPGCVFHPRCPLAVDRCRTEVPLLRAAGAGPPGGLPSRRGGTGRRGHRQPARGGLTAAGGPPARTPLTGPGLTGATVLAVPHR